MCRRTHFLNALWRRPFSFHITRTVRESTFGTYSCLFAIKVEGLGYLFTVLGRVSHDGRRVLALSVIQASRVTVPQGLHVSCPKDVSEDMGAPYLSYFVASLYVLALFAQVGPGDKMLVLEAPPALETAILDMAQERHNQIYFLSVSQGAEVLSPGKGFPRLVLHSNASLRLIESTLPADVSIFVSHPLQSGGSGDITDKSDLDQVIEEVRNTLPPLAGVANGAMVLDDIAIAEMTVEKMQKVTGLKFHGLFHLDELLGAARLDFFVLFSSVAAVVGNRGQSSYSLLCRQRLRVQPRSQETLLGPSCVCH